MERFDKMLRGLGGAGLAVLAEELLGALYPYNRRATAAKKAQEAEAAKDQAKAGARNSEGKAPTARPAAAESGEAGKTVERADGTETEYGGGGKPGAETDAESPEGFRRNAYEPFLTLDPDIRRPDFVAAESSGDEAESSWKHTDDFAQRGADARSLSEFFRRDSRRYDKEFERY